MGFPEAFEKAFPEMIGHEGGYANVSGDTGGETYKGISRNNFPNWEGWPMIDAVKKKGITKAADINNAFTKDAEMAEMVKRFYFINFWEKTK